MNVHELIEKQYGVKTTYNENPEVAAVQVTTTKVLSYNPRRLSFVFVNLSPVFVLIAPDSDVTLVPRRGIYLVPNGGTLSMVWTEDFEMATMEWFAIADGAAAADCYCLEVLTQ